MASPILLCTDGSDQAVGALAAGLELLGRHHQFVLVTVTQAPDEGSLVGSGHAGPELSPEEFDDRVAEAGQAARSVIEDTRDRLALAGAEVHILTGDPGAAICQLASRLSAGAIVVGSRWAGTVEACTPGIRLRLCGKECTVQRVRHAGSSGGPGGTMTRLGRTLAALVVVGAGTLAVTPARAGAVAPRPAPGYWLAGADGGVFSFGAPFYGSGALPSIACGFSPQPPSTLNAALGCDAIASTPTGSGYWLVNAYRLASGFGRAGQPEQLGCTSLNGAQGTWVGAASTATGDGFLLASSNGAVLGCGDAVPVVGLIHQHLNAPVVGMAATPDGRGYWLAAADGGVFAFGDAPFKGSMGGKPLDAPVVGMAATPDGRGYWLVAADGGVFAFGDAAFRGSMGGKPLDAPVVGMAATPDGQGYWLAAADGGVFAFGGAPFRGSMGGKALDAPVVGIAPYAPPAAA